jgi:hypothetical protein
MGTRDPRVDVYIHKAAPFAQPILTHLRERVHLAAPDVVETMKWSVPHFEHRGVLCSIASFRAHCAFGFWKGTLVVGDTPAVDEAMGHLGRIRSPDDLPPDDELDRLIRRAVELNELGVKAARPTGAARRDELPVPEDLVHALEERGALKQWEAFPPGKRRDYLEWLDDAKAPATRDRRLATAVEWIGEGKGRNWKYERPRRE